MAGRAGVGMAPPHMGRAEAWQSPPGGSEDHFGRSEAIEPARLHV